MSSISVFEINQTIPQTNNHSKQFSTRLTKQNQIYTEYMKREGEIGSNYRGIVCWIHGGTQSHLKTENV